MSDLKNIALLIDADNTQLDKQEFIIREVSTRGRILLKRAYGNWKKDSLKKWEDVIKRLAIKPVQQFDYVKKKNATDIALVLDAVELLHRRLYDTFAIVASDSDYTPLAIHLREAGIHVIGVGNKDTVASFKSSCDEFILLDNLELSEVQSDAEESSKQIVPEDIHNLLKIAFENYQGDDGFVNVSAAGQYINRVMPDFSTKTYGFSKLPKLLEAYPERYQIKKYQGKGTTNIIAYCCKS